MPTIISLAYDTSTGRFLSKVDGYDSSLIGLHAIISGKIGSGAIGDIHIFPDGIFAADAATRAKFADSIWTDAKIADLAATKLTGLLPHARISGLPYANLVLTNSVVDGDVVDLAATKLTGLLPHARISGLPYANLNLTNSLVAGDLTTDAVEEAKIKAGAVTSGKIGTSEIGTDHLLDALIVSSKVAATSIGTGHLENNAIVSGKLGSGAIPDSSVSEAQLVSGISIDLSEINMQPGYIAKEPISGYACVFMDNNQKFGMALAISGYMPAIGVAPPGGVASGDPGNIYFGGRCDAPSSTVSGQYGEPVFVGTSGELTLTPPGSGFIVQPLGVVAGDNSMFLFPSPIIVEIMA